MKASKAPSKAAIELFVSQLSNACGIETSRGTKVLWKELEDAGLVARMPYGGFLGHPFFFDITDNGRAFLNTLKTSAEAAETRGPLFNKDGTIAVDPQRCPTLHRILTRGLKQDRGRSGWAKVAELRANGDLEGAERAARHAMGIKGEPMDEETRAKLRAYEAEHKEAIAERRKQKRELRRRTVALLTTGRRRR